MFPAHCASVEYTLHAMAPAETHSNKAKATPAPALRAAPRPVGGNKGAPSATAAINGEARAAMSNLIVPLMCNVVPSVAASLSELLCLHDVRRSCYSSTLHGCVGHAVNLGAWHIPTTPMTMRSLMFTLQGYGKRWLTPSTGTVPCSASRS